MIKLLATAAFALLLTSMPCAAEAWQPAFDRAVTAYDAALAKENVVGSSVLLVDDTEIRAVHHYGFADWVSRTPVNDGTLFHWASVTKVFTSIAAMQLVERGLIALDDPVVDYVPEIAAVHNGFGSVRDIRIRHLLTHSAGFRSATWPWIADDDSEAPDWQPFEPAKWSQIAAMMPMTAIRFAPGSKTEYSNLGISVLGRVIERVSGDDIEVYIDKNILKPLDMTETWFDRTPYYLLPRRTHGYRVDKAQIKDFGQEIDTGATHANGGLNGSTVDMARFMIWLVNHQKSDRVLKPETLTQMLTPQLEFARDDRRTIWVGLGFFLTEERDSSGAIHRYFGHSGFQLAHRSSLYIAQDGSGGFLFAANTVSQDGNPSASALRLRLVDTVFPNLR